jgi:PadR family transcriptional regulator, regulatory protein PadR
MVDNAGAGAYILTRLSITNIDSVHRASSFSTDRKDLYSGLIRIHILFHACEGPIFGLGMIDELSRHGYRLSPGTLYPMLHSLEGKGLLRSREVRAGRWTRREYRATTAGHKALRTAKQRVRELFGEIFERR